MHLWKSGKEVWVPSQFDLLSTAPKGHLEMKLRQEVDKHSQQWQQVCDWMRPFLETTLEEVRIKCWRGKNDWE